eukprot:TRINITY_DN2222_c0_g3_i1.p1 TRINITY_DN2222_c0_g3~~TRINITY_DN2222_c0_g3_i1.p1  ORF type:complete len:138 (+),score=56.56 TRINITY_DN2222_c0_g3_i1:44-415(+)
MGLTEHEKHAVHPCEHNDWDDVRTRNGYKMLRCRVCQGRWKLPSQTVPRCMDFLHDRCKEGTHCWLLHVNRKKCTVMERYEQFGDSVLEGVAPRIQKKARRRAECGGLPVGDDGPPALLDEDV